MSLPGHGPLWLAGRLLLDGAGALFGLYLLIIVTLLLAGYAMRMRGRMAAPTTVPVRGRRAGR